MEQSKRRKLPVAQFKFDDIVRNGYVYVDKTDLALRLVESGMQYVYLSRPKRFGKSMLLDTLSFYFAGERELFDGLALGRLMEGRTWVKRPVLRLDLSECLNSVSNFRYQLGLQLRVHEEQLGLDRDDGLTPGQRMTRLLDAYKRQSPTKIAVLIDEYDAPLVEQYVNRKTGRPECLDALIEDYRGMFMSLKSRGGGIEYLHITGCTRFNGLSLFSALNNIRNISTVRDYATICGFTEQELRYNFGPELATMAERRGESLEQTLDELREHFDGYRFNCDSDVPRVYNPFSVVNALWDATDSVSKAQNIAYYWSAPSSVKALNEIWGVDFEQMLRTGKGLTLSAREMEQGDISQDNQALLLYQAGFLTQHSLADRTYQLCYPNREVRTVLVDVVLPSLLRMDEREYNREFETWREAALSGRLEEALWSLRIMLSQAPHGPKSYNGAAPEERAALLVTYICYSSHFRVEVEPKQAYGEPDRVITAGNYIYVVEFKRPATGGLAAAWRQMQEGRYVEPYLGAATSHAVSKRVVALAVLVRDDGRGLIGWRARVYSVVDGHLVVERDVEGEPRWAELERSAKRPWNRLKCWIADLWEK